LLKKVLESIGNEISQYLDDLKEYFKDNIYEMLEVLENGGDLKEFYVNVVIDNKDTTGAPVIMESSPSIQNLFGTIDSDVDTKGRKFSTFLHIRAGSLAAANGGYLILNASDIFQESPEVWIKLKRALKNKSALIEKSGDDIFPTVYLKPEAIPISLKVIILGDEGLYYNLYSVDDEFKKIFKILCEFSPHIEVTDKNISSYLSVIKKICLEEKLPPFSRKAVYLLLSEATRFTEDKNKLTARFHLIADIMREAAFLSNERKSLITDALDVEKALKNRIERHNMFEVQTLEQIKDGTVLIDVKGKRTGQVNGLTVYDYEFYSFGKPARITASTSIGSDGIINIEREADLSGNIHDKGLLILTGYLQGKYGKDFPITINATICFEQSYGGVDGDSASSTEAYAII
jgi:ATP-dependent Lon protease